MQSCSHFFPKSTVASPTISLCSKGHQFQRRFTSALGLFQWCFSSSGGIFGSVLSLFPQNQGSTRFPATPLGVFWYGTSPSHSKSTLAISRIYLRQDAKWPSALALCLSWCGALGRCQGIGEQVARRCQGTKCPWPPSTAHFGEFEIGRFTSGAISGATISAISLYERWSRTIAD